MRKEIAAIILIVFTGLLWFTYFLSRIEIISTEAVGVRMVTKEKIVPENPIVSLHFDYLDSTKFIVGQNWVEYEGCVNTTRFELNMSEVKDDAKRRVEEANYFTINISCCIVEVRGASVKKTIESYDEIDEFYHKYGNIVFTIRIENGETYESDFYKVPIEITIKPDEELVPFIVKTWSCNVSRIIFVSTNVEFDVLCWDEEPHTVEYQEPEPLFYEVRRHLVGDGGVPNYEIQNILFYDNSLTRTILFALSAIVTVITITTISIFRKKSKPLAKLEEKRG